MAAAMHTHSTTIICFMANFEVLGANSSSLGLGVALDGYVREMALDAYAIRCWSELQAELKIAPCAVMGLFNQAGISAACETDVTNAVMMQAPAAQG